MRWPSGRDMRLLTQPGIASYSQGLVHTTGDYAGITDPPRPRAGGAPVKSENASRKRGREKGCQSRE